MQKQNSLENIFSEIRAENFLNLEKDMAIYIQEVHRTHNSHDQYIQHDTYSSQTFKNKT